MYAQWPLFELSASLFHACNLHPTTTDEELLRCVDAMKGDTDVKQVVCTRLKSKYENCKPRTMLKLRLTQLLLCFHRSW